MRGHLVYLIITTLEGETHHITGATSGFWVSRSSNAHFDPSPKAITPKGLHSAPYHSLFEICSALSPQFSKGLVEIIQKNNPSGDATDIYGAIPITHDTPAASWIVPAPIHTADPFRTQIAYLLTNSTTADLLPAARDWNDEFSQFKELPVITLQDRLIRERLLSRTQSDYLIAATKGALSIARGDVPPLNPNEPEEAHTFVHNSMLFTKADHAVNFDHVGGSEASRVSASKDLRGVGLLEKLDVAKLHTMSTVIVDYCGERYVVQSIIPGLFKTKEQEEVAKEEEDSADVIVGGDKDDYPTSGVFRIIYGSANPEIPDERIKASKYFGDLAQQVADALYLAEHSVVDSTKRETKLWLSADVHGIAGPDGRSYVIDCGKLVYWSRRSSEY
jgi:protein TIF31